MPLAFDADHDRYSIPGTYFLPPINFTPAEALSLVALASELGRSDRLPFYEPAQRGRAELEDSLPPALREELREMSRGPFASSRCRSARWTAKRGIYQQLVDAARAAGRADRVRQPHRMGADRARSCGPTNCCSAATAGT